MQLLKQILWTACITPFDAQGRVDFQSMERCLRLQEKCGNGILLLGSTGEALSLSEKEKKAILTFACELQLQTQIIVGVPGHNQQNALEWLNFCQDLPVHGYLMTTPIYTKPGIIGQTKWFEALLDNAAHPSILYNIPSRSGVKLYSETVKNLQHHPKFVAIKNSSGNIESCLEYTTVAPGIAIYCGDDYMMPAMAAEGSIGLISVASNAWPSAVRKYVECSLKGITDPSKTWWIVSRELSAASNPVPIKALMHSLRLIKCNHLRLPLSIEDLPSYQAVLSCHNVVTAWAEKFSITAEN